mmetsp:Transcript_30199/g.97459  ORF Transcript_30199/g.97459 Transcript_30199/m.97459 type:complete len:250 (+) Transcript_30199:144-893(+)
MIRMLKSCGWLCWGVSWMKDQQGRGGLLRRSLLVRVRAASWLVAALSRYAVAPCRRSAVNAAATRLSGLQAARHLDLAHRLELCDLDQPELLHQLGLLRCHRPASAPLRLERARVLKQRLDLGLLLADHGLRPLQRLAHWVQLRGKRAAELILQLSHARFGRLHFHGRQRRGGAKLRLAGVHLLLRSVASGRRLCSRRLGRGHVRQRCTQLLPDLLELVRHVARRRPGVYAVRSVAAARLGWLSLWMRR